MFRDGPPNWRSPFTESHFPGWVGRRISSSFFSFPVIIRSIKGRTSRSQKVIPQPPRSRTRKSKTRSEIDNMQERLGCMHAKTMSTSWASYRNARTVGPGQAPCYLPTRNSYPAICPPSTRKQFLRSDGARARQKQGHTEGHAEAESQKE